MQHREYTESHVAVEVACSNMDYLEHHIYLTAYCVVYMYNLYDDYDCWLVDG